MIAATASSRRYLPVPAVPVEPHPVDVLGATGTVDPYDPKVVAQRLEAGRRAEREGDTLPPHLVGRAAPAYFRTYEQLKSALYALQAKYPGLAEVRDIGDTWEKTQGKADRDVLALVLTNRAITGDKPSTMHVGGMHAREIANPELLMTFGTRLLEGYGRDPEATMLLDGREIVLVPMLNADGHAVVERGFDGAKDGNLMKRTNTSGPGNGTDLNRNFEYKWGGAGSSPNPKSEVYRGASAGSEPETRAIQSYVKAHKPDFFMDWHSYSKLNMFPWGDSPEKTKDHLGFKALAQKFTTYNGYSPIQSVELYPTTGTSDDHAYGAEGVPSMAVETGSSFHQTDAEFATTLRDNLPVLTYVTKVADAPFQRVFGPDAGAVVVDAAAQRLRASVTDAQNGGRPIAGAELVLDQRAAPGTGVALQADDGAFDEVEETVTGSTGALAIGDAQAGGRLVFVRGRDADGNWGPLAAQWLVAPAGVAATA